VSPHRQSHPTLSPSLLAPPALPQTSTVLPTLLSSVPLNYGYHASNLLDVIMDEYKSLGLPRWWTMNRIFREDEQWGKLLW